MISARGESSGDMAINRAHYTTNLCTLHSPAPSGCLLGSKGLMKQTVKTIAQVTWGQYPHPMEGVACVYTPSFDPEIYCG